MKKYAAALGEILYRKKVLTKQDQQALSRDFTEGDPAQLNYFLLDEALVDKQELLSALAEYYQIPYFDVRGYQFNHELLALFPQQVLVQYAILPIEFDDNILTVVAGQPDRPGLREILRQYTSYHIEFRVGITRDIVDEIRSYYEDPPNEAEIDREEDEHNDTDIVDIV